MRTAVMWLVAVALPLQGLAAATMLSCGPGHHRMVTQQSAKAAVQDHASHEHGGAAKEVASAGSAGVLDVGGAVLAQDLQQLAKFKCSACAACCSATVLPPSVMNFDPPRQAAVFDVVAPAWSVQFQTGGPERPPRNTLV